MNRCHDCSTLIPHQARFCPRCGKPAPAEDPLTPRRAPGAISSSGQWPWAGKVFGLFSVLALGAIVLGISIHVLAVVYTGIGLLALIILLMVVGDSLGL